MGEFILLYFILLSFNFPIFIGEVFVLKIDYKQSLVARGSTIISDFVETYFYISHNFLEAFSIYFLNIIGLENIDGNPLVYGVKLALIGPNIYIVKLFLCNFLFIPVVNYYSPLEILKIKKDKLFLAYFGAMGWCLFIGTAWKIFVNYF